MKKQFLLLLAMATTTGIHAQRDTLNAVINVENNYNPVVTQATKRGFIPKTEENITGTPLELEFSQKATPFKEFAGERDVRDILPGQQENRPGYVRIGSGTGSNTDAKLSYEYNISKNDRFRVIASHDGYNSELEGTAGEWDSRFYSSWVSADYSHRFNNLTLGVNGMFGNNVYNYQTIIPTDKQNNKQMSFGINTVSALAGPFAFEAGAGFSRTQYNYLWNEGHRFGENKFSLDGLVRYELTDARLRSINLGVDIDNYIYNGLEGYDNFMSAAFNPYMIWLSGSTRIKIGASVSLLTDNGSTFAIAPDIDFECAINNTLTLYATVKGGRDINSIERIEQVSPYWVCDNQIKPSYTIADITAGARISVQSFSFDFHAGHAYTKDDLLAIGVYYLLDEGVYSAMALENTSKFYVGARAGYDYGGWLKASLAAQYNHWHCNAKYLLDTKPELEAGANIEARFLEDFYVSAEYNFATYAYDIPSLNKNELNVRATWKFLERFGVFAEGNNLLNRDYIKYAGYYEQGINMLLGVSATF